MKFAQYLRDTQTPEWKKAYIDYRGLKKRITAIRKAEQGLDFTASPDDSPAHPATPAATPRTSSITLPLDTIDNPRESSSKPRQRRNTVTSIARQAFSSAVPDDVRKSPAMGGRAGSYHRHRPSLSVRFGGGVGKPTNPMTGMPLQDILLQLSPLEVAFFNMLDSQLEKVETFYVTREKEAVAKGKLLEIQLQELVEHRKIYQRAHTKVPWAAAISAVLKSKSKRGVKITRTKSISEQSGETRIPGWLGFGKPSTPIASPGINSRTSSNASSEDEKCDKPDDGPSPNGNSQSSDDETSHRLAFAADPDNYLYAKRKLKKAVVEHYRGLELLHNYRVLNLTGFRKALKKFEKVTRIPVQNEYWKEKVERSEFASDKSIREMMKEMEEMYANTFVKGDKKKAMKRLRGGHRMKSHHFSTFRSGILLGLAIPAIIAGFVNGFQAENRAAIHGWGALMVVYATLFVPTLFAALVGLNLLVWARSRINYVFIFELESITALDYREYFEVPSILLAGLAYCFWLSFSRIGSHVVSPDVWPLVWLGGTALIVFNPFPVLFHNTRFWLIRVIAKLFLTGTRRVEFTDFWIGDQFCSLVFTLQNIYFIGCVYADNFSPEWKSNCGLTSKHWPASFILAVLPFILRLVQSLKRFYDSGLVTHLINGGKYGSGIVSYLIFFIWRHHGTQRSGALFAFWCICNTLYAIYACTWDFLMDWSVLRVHSPNALLRPELVYSSQIPLYYFAIVTNLLLRFSWVIYIPEAGPDMLVRSFIIAVLEIFRRWQWNFYRLENEHLGNMDQYRVTREVPLPYLFDDPRREDDADDDDDEDSQQSK